MSNEDEVRLYLRFLLDHREGCTLEVCPSCRALQKACELFGHQIFSCSAVPKLNSSVRQCLNSTLRWHRGRELLQKSRPS
jgi:hypothetical protein